MARRLASWGVLLFVAGCGGGISTGDWVVDTVLDRDTIAAGETVTVTCTFTKGGIEAEGVTTKVTISPAASGTIDDPVVTETADETGGTGSHALKGLKAGEIAVTCALVDRDLADDTPAILKVVPGAPSRVVAVLDKSTTPAGIPVDVDCRVEDAWGNEILDAPTVVEPKPDLEVAQKTVSSTKIGEHEVTCAVDEAPEVEKVPATLTVTPGEPVEVVITADPDWKSYDYDDKVKVWYKILDAFGNEVPGVKATITPPDSKGLLHVSGSTYQFKAQGAYLFTATVEAPYQDVTATRVLICDWSGPDIEVFFPPRGYTKDGDDPGLTVKGRATDVGSSVTEVTVNGVPADLKADGSFTLPVQSIHGLNGLVVQAKDPFGQSSYITRGYYYSREWIPVGPQATIDDLTLADGAMVFLGQTALDDGDHDPAHLDDIATILEVVLASAMDLLTAQLPPFEFPLPGLINLKIAGVGLEGDLIIGIQVKQLDLGQPYVGVKCRDGGVAVSIAFQPVTIALDLTVTVHARATGFGQSIDLLDPSTTIGTALEVGKLGITLDMDLHKDPGGAFTAEGKNFQLELNNVQFHPITNLVIKLGKIPGTNIDLGQLDLSQIVGNISDFLANTILNPLVNFITQPLINLLEPLVTGLVGDALEQLVGLFAIHQTFPLPSILGSQSVDLEFQTSLSSVHFTPDGGQLGLNLGLLTEKNVDHEPIGTILRAQCNGADPATGDFSFEPQPEIQMAVQYDLVNELLWALWRSGMLKGPFDLSEMAAGTGFISKLIIEPDFYLPPILDNCQDRTQEIQVGDAYLVVDLGLAIVGVWLQVRAQAEIVADGNEIGIRIGKISFFEYEIEDLTGGLGDLLDLVVDFLPGLLSMVEGQEFKFPIPAIPVGGLLPGIPANAQIELGNLSSTTDGPVITFGGDLL